MNEQVKRFRTSIQHDYETGISGGTMVESHTGGYVWYDDYDQLRQRVGEVEAKRDLNARMLTEELTRNEHLEAKLALAEKDARRYRWLRDNAASAPGNTPCPYRWTNSDVPETVNGDFLDSEIDAAMRAAIDASGHDSLPTGD